jgi:hypothetical protein
VLAGETDVRGAVVIDGNKGYARIHVHIMDRQNSARVHVYHKTAVLDRIMSVPGYMQELAQTKPLTIEVFLMGS